MSDGDQPDLLSPLSDLALAQQLIADLHDDLSGKVARFRQLNDLSADLGSGGTLFFGGEVTFAAWTEARLCFVNGNYIATVMLCQALVEHVLAGFLSMGTELPKRISFSETLQQCLKENIITPDSAKDLRRLMELRNPLSHFREIDDPSSLTRRMFETRRSVESHLFGDASFAMSAVIRLIAMSPFRVGR